MKNLGKLELIVHQTLRDNLKNGYGCSLKELFSNISKNKTLSDISVSFYEELPQETLLNPQDIYLPLRNHPSVRTIHLNWDREVKRASCFNFRRVFVIYFDVFYHRVYQRNTSMS